MSSVNPGNYGTTFFSHADVNSVTYDFLCGSTAISKGQLSNFSQTTFHPIKVEDEEGHIIAVFENTQVYTDSDTGENSVGKGKGLLDMNVKTGKGTLKGYSIRTFSNGDTYVSEWEGKPVEKGIAQGTYKILKGTGTLEGLTGEGTWRTTSLAPGVSVGEYEGVRRMHGQ